MRLSVTPNIKCYQSFVTEFMTQADVNRYPLCIDMNLLHVFTSIFLEIFNILLYAQRQVYYLMI